MKTPPEATEPVAQPASPQPLTALQQALREEAGPAVVIGTASPARAKNRDVDRLAGNRWTRWIFPSMTDLLFVASMAWMFMSSGKHGWQSLLADGDVGWHIRVGQYILSHGKVPQQDLFSFSKPGAPWFAWEWLADVIDAGLHNAAGLKGIVLIAGAIIAWFGITLLRRAVVAGAHPFIALLVMLLGTGAASIHYLARPHIYTLLLLSLCMGMLEADRRRQNQKTPARYLWWLIPVTLLWTNLHGGFLVLVLVLGLATLGNIIETVWEQADLAGGLDLAGRHLASADWSRSCQYGLLTLGCAAVSLVNPYGWGLHKHVIEYLRSDWIRNIIQEFQSPSFRSESMMQFEVLLFVGLISLGALVRRRRIVESLWILAFAYLALSGARHVPVFVAAVSPLIALEMSWWWRQLAGAASRKSILGILNQVAADIEPGFRRSSLLPLMFVAGLAVLGSPTPWPTDFPPEVFPVEMVHAHEAQILQARLLTTDQWADYLIYLHPEQKVFVDGRSDFYGPEVGNQFLHVINGAPDWSKVMDKFQFNLALLPVDVPLAQLLKQQPVWRVVADNGKQILLARNAPSLVLTKAKN